MKVDVAIIGAGPAGLSAAIEAAQAGLSVVVVDEYFRPGGRLLGQLYEDPQSPDGKGVWNGIHVANGLQTEAQKLGVEIFCGVTAWSVSGRWRLHLSGAQVPELEATALLLATGAAERAVPLPGWTLPGVVSVGGAQTFTNVHRIAVGERVMVVGVDPLALSVALEMHHAGMKVVGVALPPMSPATGHLASPLQAVRRLAQVSEFAPNAVLRSMGRLATGRLSTLAVHALRMNLLRVKGIPVYLRKAVVGIEGTDAVENVTLRNVAVNGTPTGVPQQVEVDAVCLSGGLYPLADFAQVSGCPLADVPELGGVVPIHNRDMSTPVENLFVAGNITGIENAKVAMAQGRVAGISIANSLGRRPGTTVETAMRQVEEARRASAFRFLPDIEAGRSKMDGLWETARDGGQMAWTI